MTLEGQKKLSQYYYNQHLSFVSLFPALEVKSLYFSLILLTHHDSQMNLMTFNREELIVGHQKTNFGYQGNKVWCSLTRKYRAYNIVNYLFKVVRNGSYKKRNLQ